MPDRETLTGPWNRGIPRHSVRNNYREMAARSYS
jgi:hypothetical protein